MKISVETTVNAPLELVWNAWIQPEDITQWNFASEDWCCPNATIDFKVGGGFSYRMEAKDGSAGFDFKGTFTTIDALKLIEYAIDDGRRVKISFSSLESGTRVVEVFEAENLHSAEQQKQGWQSIMDNFKLHVESKIR